MKERTMTGLKLPLALGVACCLALWPATSVAADPTPEVEIRSGDGKVLIAADQIRSYEWATHTLTLAPKARDELAKRLAKDRIVSGIPFAVTVGGKDVYKGKFTTVVSSMSFSTPIIVVDAQAVEPKLGADQLRIQLGYPTAEFFKGKDPRGDRRVREALKAADKLTEAESEHSKWLAKSLREIQTIKPGMTREELLKVFQEEEGGLSSRTQQRYAFRECPYIKVDVTFEAVGALEGKLTKSPKDKITKISTPFLEWPIID
jgi:hypothetical protein